MVRGLLWLNEAGTKSGGGFRYKKWTTIAICPMAMAERAPDTTHSDLKYIDQRKKKDTTPYPHHQSPKP
jgi:hypothetical protein